MLSVVLGNHPHINTINNPIAIHYLILLVSFANKTIDLPFNISPIRWFDITIIHGAVCGHFFSAFSGCIVRAMEHRFIWSPCFSFNRTQRPNDFCVGHRVFVDPLLVIRSIEYWFCSSFGLLVLLSNFQNPVGSHCKLLYIRKQTNKQMANEICKQVII